MSEVAAEPPDPYVVNATDDRTSVTIQRYFYHLTYHGTIEIGSWQHWQQDS